MSRLVLIGRCEIDDGLDIEKVIEVDFSPEMLPHLQAMGRAGIANDPKIAMLNAALLERAEL